MNRPEPWEVDSRIPVGATHCTDNGYRSELMSLDVYPYEDIWDDPDYAEERKTPSVHVQSSHVLMGLDEAGELTYWKQVK